MQHKTPCSYCIFLCFSVIDLSNFIAKIIDMPCFFTSFPISLAFIVKFCYKYWSCTQPLLKAARIFVLIYLFDWGRKKGNSFLEPLTWSKTVLSICPKFLICVTVNPAPFSPFPVRSSLLTTSCLEVIEMDFQLEHIEI